MKKILILYSILTSFVASAQSIEINPNGGTNASAILDLKSTTKGFLLPRMTNDQMRAIPSPAQGLLVFCTNCGTTANGEYYFYKGTAWVILSSTTVTSFTSIGAVSDVASSQGASVTSDGVLNLAPANATKPGIITATDQTFGGVKTFSNGIVGNVTGNATTVTTNANLTGVVTSTGNATSIADRAITNAMLANGAVATLSGTNTGDQTLPTLSSLGALASNTAITGATNTKITYDAKGLVTAGAGATTTDIAESTDKKYVTDAQLTKINNTSGINTGDNAVNSLYSGLVTNATHTGDVTGATALTIANDAVTAAKIAAGAITDSKVTDVAASKITGTLPVSKGGTGATTLASNNVLLGNGTSALQAVAPGANGNVLTSNGTTWTSVAASAGAAAAGTLTGTTLASNVVNSSLTSVGTLSSATVNGKVTVGASSATATSAVLEANSTTQGFLPPKMTFAQRNLINNPVQGLMIYCTNCNTNGELQIYNGSNTWTNMIGGTANGVVSLSIGQSYQGGIVAYILQLGDPGYDPNAQHGLIAAAADASPGIKWQNRTAIDTGAYGTSLGTGLSNTNKITTIQGEITIDYAAGVASALTDWCLPSKDELAKLYEMKLLGFGSFTNEYYWSSSQDGINFSDFAWSLDFSNGTLGKTATYVNYRVRAIRYF